MVISIGSAKGISSSNTSKSVTNARINWTEILSFHRELDRKFAVYTNKIVPLTMVNKLLDIILNFILKNLDI